MAPGAPPTRRFVNHPGAKEAPAHALQYEPAVDTNPVLRGWPLVVASTMYVPPTRMSNHSGTVGLSAIATRAVLCPCIMLMGRCH